LALNSEDHPLAATIIYYGNLVNDTYALSKIKWPVLGIFGDQDQSIPVNSVKQFDQALNKIGVTNEINIYPGLGHAFAILLMITMLQARQLMHGKRCWHS
jgi:carboxymethylenebutenolidase